MVIVDATNSFKCKLLYGTFKEEALHKYINHTRFFITRYQDLSGYQIHQFSSSKHRKVSNINLFNTRHGNFEFLREYLARFNEATIKVITLINNYLYVLSKMGLKRDLLINPSM